MSYDYYLNVEGCLAAPFGLNWGEIASASCSTPCYNSIRPDATTSPLNCSLLRTIYIFLILLSLFVVKLKLGI